MFWRRKPEPVETRIRRYLIEEHLRCVKTACDAATDYALGAMDEVSKILGDVQAICEGGEDGSKS